MMAQNVTIYDIARAAGVSPSTVSRALGKPGRLSAKTEQKVHRVAKELGYLAPDRTDGVSATPSSGMVAILVRDFDDPYTARILNAIESNLERRGYAGVCAGVVMNNEVRRRAISLLLRDVDGVILVAPSVSEPDLRRMSVSRPIVLVNQQISGLSTVTVDCTEAVDQAMRTLKRTGHRSVTSFMGVDSSWLGESHRRALKAAAYRYDLEYRLVRGLDSGEVGGGQALQRYLIHPTDAVFTCDGGMAAGFNAAAHARGLSVPDDVSIIAFADDAMGASMLPPLTVIGQRAEQLGAEAAEMIVSLIRSPHSRRVGVVEKAKLIGRDSVSRRKRSAIPAEPAAEPTTARVDDGTTTLTMLSASFTEVMPRIEEFQRTHPGILIDTIDAHTNQMACDLYRERLQSHRMVPDLFNLDIDLMPEFAASGAFLNLHTPENEAQWGPLFNPVSWRNVHYAGDLYGLPGDQPHTAMFYREDILRRYDLKIPRTWDQFREEGIELRRHSTRTCMGVLDTSMQYYLAFLRSAGARPWKLMATDRIAFDLDDPRMLQAAEFLQGCLDDGVLIAHPIWDGRYVTIRDGQTATLLHGNWLGKIIASSYPDAAGLWKVAVPPAFGNDPSALQTTQVGGSMMAISARIPRDRQLAALQFVQWMQTDPVSIDMRAAGGYSATRYFENKPELEDLIDPFFRQPVYRAYMESARHVNLEWDHLPFSTFMDRGFRDTVLPELRPGGHSPAAIRRWLEELPAYASAHGFTVE